MTEVVAAPVTEPAAVPAEPVAEAANDESAAVAAEEPVPAPTGEEG